MFIRQVHITLLHVFLTDRYNVVLLFLTNRRVSDGVGRLMALPSLDRIGIYSSKQAQSAQFTGEMSVIGRICKQQKLTLCQVSDTKGPLFARNLELNGNKPAMLIVRRFELNCC